MSDSTIAADIGSMDEQDRQLGTVPIKSLYAKYSITTLIGMLAQAIMVILEGVIIGNGLGTLGLATISVIMPLEMLSLALGGFFGLGISSIAAIKLGKNDIEGAKTVFSQGFWFSMIFSILLSAIVFFNAESISLMLGATSDITADTVLFVKVFMLGYPLCIIGQLLVFVLRTDEKPGLASFFMTGSAVVALASLFVGVFIFDLGIRAAAIYYILSIGLWFLSIFYFLFNKQTVFKIDLKGLKINFSVINQALKIGTPYFIIQASSFVYTIVINNLLSQTGGSIDIAAFSIINGYLIYILMMVCTGMTQAMQPIASYNYGAKKLERVKELIKVSLTSTFLVLVFLSVITIIFIKPIIGIFAAGDTELITIASKYTFLVVLLSAFGSVSVLVSGYFQAIEKVTVSTLLGISRYVLFAIPLMLVLVKPFGIMGIWYSHPIADFLAFSLSLILLYREYKTYNTEIS